MQQQSPDQKFQKINKGKQSYKKKNIEFYEIISQTGWGVNLISYLLFRNSKYPKFRLKNWNAKDFINRGRGCGGSLFYENYRSKETWLTSWQLKSFCVSGKFLNIILKSTL